MVNAKLISTLTLVLTSLFMVGLASLSTGGILDACNQMSLSGATHAECRAFFASALGKRPTELTKSLVAYALVFPRIEASLFLGMGLGGVYALLRLPKGTPAVAVVHLMQAVALTCCASIHAHNSGLLPLEVDPNLRLEGEPFLPFMAVTGALAALCWASLALSSGNIEAVDVVKQVEEAKATEKAAQLIQASLRGKEVREQEALRKRRSSIGSAQI
jgi:hypothetical protein